MSVRACSAEPRRSENINRSFAPQSNRVDDGDLDCTDLEPGSTLLPQRLRCRALRLTSIDNSKMACGMA